MTGLGIRAASADQYTDEISAYQAQVAHNNAAIAAAKASDAALQQSEQQITAAITTLDAQITAKQGQIDSTTATLDEIQANLRAAQARLAAAEHQLAVDRQHLATQIVVSYELQQQSTTLNNLLTSGNFNEFFTNLLDTRRISADENAEVNTINGERAQIQDDVDVIATERQQVQWQLQQLRQEKTALDAQKTLQQNDLATQEQLQAIAEQKMQQAEAANAFAQAQIAKYNQLEQQELAYLAQQQRAGGGPLFGWPNQGQITQGFGCTPFIFEMYDPACPTKHFHAGIDIAGPCGEDITAAAAGIAYIQPYDPYGYGNYIIIVHGNGWDTLYGHMSGFAIGSGVTVQRGQLIGWEGSTGNSTGCHLHFGVNDNGSWVNPLAYLS